MPLLSATARVFNGWVFCEQQDPLCCVSGKEDRYVTYANHIKYILKPQTTLLVCRIGGDSALHTNDIYKCMYSMRIL